MSTHIYNHVMVSYIPHLHLTPFAPLPHRPKAAAPDAAAAPLELAPDFGPARPSARSGVAVVGAMPYVTNFNVEVFGATHAQ